MSSSSSQAISPEVAELFSCIEKQAEQYKQAFDDLNSFFSKAERLKRQLEEMYAKNLELYDKCIEQFNKFNAIDDYINLRLETIIKELKDYLTMILISEFQKKTAEKLDEFEKNTEKALGIITGESGIAQFIEDIKNFETRKDIKLIELDEKIENLSILSKELENSKKEYPKLVRYVNFKISDYEQKINEKLELEKIDNEKTLQEALSKIDEKIKEEMLNFHKLLLK